MSQPFLATNRQLWKLNQLGHLKLVLDPDTERKHFPMYVGAPIDKNSAEAALKMLLDPDISAHASG